MFLKIYDLLKCGFYKRGEDVPVFGDISEWWPSFVKWAEEQGDIQSTELVTEGLIGIPSIYCSSAFMTSDSYGLVLWNQVPATEKGVLSIPAAGTVGNITADATSTGKGRIPGWPSYYWIVPRDKIVVTFVHDNLQGYHSDNMKGFRCYLKMFLTKRSHYCISSETEDNERLGWSETGHEEDRSKYSIRAALETKPLMIPYTLDRIRRRRLEIRRVIAEEPLSNAKKEYYESAQKVFKYFGVNLKSLCNNRKETKFRVISDWNPTSEELEEAITSFSSESGDRRMGVYFKGEQSPVWFDRIIARKEVTLASSLNAELLWNKKHLIAVHQAAAGKINELLREADRR